MAQEADPSQRRVLFLAGLFLATLSTLLLEMLNTRLLSVATWYHLSFFAVSTAMFGMAAGAIRVYLGGAAYEGAAAREALARWTGWLALAIPLSHVVVLCVPIQLGASALAISGLIVATIAISAPFYVAGVVVAIALTRIPGPSGLVYAIDLLGAAAGSLLILPLLGRFDISSTALLCGAIAALSAALFHGSSGAPRRRVLVQGALAVALAGLALLNSASHEGLRVTYSKSRMIDWQRVASEAWSIHGRVITMQEVSDTGPWYWGAGSGVDQYEVDIVPMDIDGMAATVMTKWDGKDRSALSWVGHGVTSLPYHLRKGGDAAVIGVGGGRDLLTALWAGSRSVVGVEINHAFLHNLRGPYRAFAGIAERPEVRLVHDEARSYFTRTDERFDVLQMSLIDTWAATGAGAFTLSENGLYTLEGWREFLRVLKPTGIFSVSRWHVPGQYSETTRLVALAVASLLERGVTDPGRHLVLVARNLTATLLVSPTPFRPRDLSTIQKVSDQMNFSILLGPGKTNRGNPFLAEIAGSRTREELERATRHDLYDFSPPTDQRPYFFNLLKPGGLLAFDERLNEGALLGGNLVATRTLALLWIVSFLLVLAAILWPLVRSGRPQLEGPLFAHALGYFALIGAGFMMVQIALIQRFSVYLGHPTYAVAVILFSMILATGVGSWLSDRVEIETSRRWVRAGPAVIGAILILLVFALQPLIDASLRMSLLARCSIVVSVVGAAALPLGFCFPLGLRLVRKLAEDAMPWMWGVNGAFGVLSSVTAVWISMWVGIDSALGIAALLYALLAIPAAALWNAVARRETAN